MVMGIGLQGIYYCKFCNQPFILMKMEMDLGTNLNSIGFPFSRKWRTRKNTDLTKISLKLQWF